MKLRFKFSEYVSGYKSTDLNIDCRLCKHLKKDWTCFRCITEMDEEIISEGCCPNFRANRKAFKKLV